MKLQNHKPFRETQLTANLPVKKEKNIQGSSQLPYCDFYKLCKFKVVTAEAAQIGKYTLVVLQPPTVPCCLGEGCLV